MIFSFQKSIILWLCTFLVLQTIIVHAVNTVEITQTYPTTVSQLQEISKENGCKPAFNIRNTAIASWKVVRLHGSFFALKFTSFNLLPNDELRIESEGTKEKEIFNGKDINRSLPFYTKTFYGTSTLRILFSSNISCYGSFNISEVITDVSKTILPSKSNDSKQESICGENEMIDIACLESNDLRRLTSRSVVRLLIHKAFGSVYCTGWILGCEGHIITNYHCIPNDAEAKTTTIEILAEGKYCPAVKPMTSISFIDSFGNGLFDQSSSLKSNCAQKGGCPGESYCQPGQATYVTGSKELDYSLVTIPSLRKRNFQKYGYLQFREVPPSVGEAIYIPQHPFGFGKQIAFNYQGKQGRIMSTDVYVCRDHDFTYNLTTDHGSSGSPVISVKENVVIGLHHCGGCPNGAVPGNLIVDDLRAKSKLPLCAVARQN